MTLYSILLLFSFIVPFALSFDKKLQFYKQWKYLVPAISLVAVFYIVFDVYFTHLGIWGFNSQYHSDIYLMGLPLEEWLFFFVIPYSSIFLHDSIVLYFSKFQLSNTYSNYLSGLIILLSILLVIFNLDKAYTSYIFILVAVVLILSYFDTTRIINKFYCTFLVILIPFVVVNAILTGSFIEQTVV